MFCNIFSTQDHAAAGTAQLAWARISRGTETRFPNSGGAPSRSAPLWVRTVSTTASCAQWMMIGDKRVCGYGDVSKPCTFTSQDSGAQVYGDVGKACAFILRGSCAKVLILEGEPVGAMQVDMEDFMVAAVESAVLEIAICVLSNGNANICTREHMKEMKSNARSPFGAGTRGLISDIEWWVEGFTGRLPNFVLCSLSPDKAITSMSRLTALYSHRA